LAPSARLNLDPNDRNEIRLDCNVTPSDACHETTALSFPTGPDAAVSRKTLDCNETSHQRNG